MAGAETAGEAQGGDSRERGGDGREGEEGGGGLHVHVHYDVEKIILF